MVQRLGCSAKLIDHDRRADFSNDWPQIAKTAMLRSPVMY
jgi:hypothetical protein